MEKENFLKDLENYAETWLGSYAGYPGFSAARETNAIKRMKTLATEPKCMERSLFPGHFTGSALVATPDLSRVLLAHHRKLDKWLQLGGHAEGEANLFETARREATEEGGISELDYFRFAPGARPVPLDLDIHKIPARKDEPDHEHYDVRYLMVVPRFQEPTVSSESCDVRWCTLEEARLLTQEESMLRLFDKLEYLSELRSFKNQSPAQTPVASYSPQP